MLIDQATLARIADGSVTLAFRRWKRPTVKADGTLLTSIGQLRVTSLDAVEPDDISDVDARAAGFEDADVLRAELAKRKDGSVYRIGLRVAGPDPRVELRSRVPEGDELEEIIERLERWTWALDALQLIRDRPAVRAGDLAPRVGMETGRFKAHVRRLKALGLTESLDIGYRLSPRGVVVLERLESRAR
ncbi:MAG: hypothetical protein PVH96_07015 [Gemmatimonadota bacterium]|jgi:hypothetical protein